MSDLVRINAISSEHVQSLRNIYISNMKWQSSNFHPIKQWFDEWKRDDNDADGANAVIVSAIIVLGGVIANWFM